jgi:hypothetical protein
VGDDMIQMDHKKRLIFKNFCLIPDTYSYPVAIILSLLMIINGFGWGAFFALVAIILSLLMLINRHGNFAKTRESILLDF